MQIVIDINDNEYLGIKNYPDNITSYPVTIHLYEAVRNGTPLPKGHGRLIDADMLLINTDSTDKCHPPIITTLDVRYASTIIEAESEG